jgi:hypothetical protein
MTVKAEKLDLLRLHSGWGSGVSILPIELGFIESLSQFYQDNSLPHFCI